MSRTVISIVAGQNVFCGEPFVNAQFSNILAAANICDGAISLCPCLMAFKKLQSKL